MDTSLKRRENITNKEYLCNLILIAKILTRLTVTTPPSIVSLHKYEFDIARWSIMQYGMYYETGISENTATIVNETGKDQMFINVGMNIGWFSLYALAMGAQVHAFEPNPVNRLRFCESAIANNFPKKTIFICMRVL